MHTVLCITSIQYFTHAYNFVLELFNLVFFRVFKLMSCMSMLSLQYYEIFIFE